jgi:hypothetical protein
MTGSAVFALALRLKVGFVRPTFRRIAATGFTTGVDFEASASVFFAVFAAAGCFLTAAGVGRAGDFIFATSFRILETGFDFSVGLGGIFLDLPIFIGGPRDLRLQRAPNYSPAQYPSNQNSVRTSTETSPSVQRDVLF